VFGNGVFVIKQAARNAGMTSIDALVREQQRGYIPLLLLLPVRVRVLVLLVNAPAQVGCWPQSCCQCSHRYIDIWVYASILEFGVYQGVLPLHPQLDFERRGSIIVISANEDRLMYTLYFWTPCDQNMKVISTLHQSVSIGDFSTHISYLILIVLFRFTSSVQLQVAFPS